MHNNYYFLRHLTAALDQRLNGFTLVSCFSQNKDELVMEFNNAKTSFFLRADLSASFCCLSFPDSFSRAGKNSVDLFPEVELKKVIGMRQYTNERCFSILLEDHLMLLFKMHGNRANIVLFNNGVATEIFRHHLQTDLEIKVDSLDRIIDWSKDFFVSHQDSIRNDYFTFGKPVWRALDNAGFEAAGMETRWQLLQDMIQQLENPRYYICEQNTALSLLLFRSDKVLKEFDDPLRAVTEFYFTSMATRSFFEQKSAALRILLAERTGAETYLAKVRSKLAETESDDHYKVWADLIMAILYKLDASKQIVTLENFYNENTPVDIPLKKTMSPQKNAEVYYRKSKNRHIEIEKLAEAKAAKEKELVVINARLALIENESTLKSLRQRLEETGLAEHRKEKQPELVPYREFEFKGYRIWVGRNAESNDKLTLKYSFKDDLWLHAKDVAGSHVLLKYQSGKNFPKDVIERAAELAAWYSKRKNESLCPVAFTLKKYVRKRKGDPAGAVIVEREEVILVEPKNL